MQLLYISFARNIYSVKRIWELEEHISAEKNRKDKT